MRHPFSLLAVTFLFLAAGPACYALDLSGISWDCENDTLVEKSDTTRGGEDANITFTEISSDKIRYNFNSGGRDVPLSTDTSKVASLCFGSHSRVFAEALEAYEAGDCAAAASGFEAAAKERGKAMVWVAQLGLYYAGMAHMQCGDAGAAGRNFNALMKDFPKNLFVAQVQRELVRIKAASDVAGAVTLIDEILRGSGVGNDERYELLFLKGQLLEQMKRWVQATEAYNDARSAAGKLSSEESSKARLRCDLGKASVSLGEGNLAAARQEAAKVLRSTTYSEVAEHEARAFAYLLEGNCLLAEAQLVQGDPNKVRQLWGEALERFLRVVAIYGGSSDVSADIRGSAFKQLDFLAGKLGQRDVQGAAAAKASVYGF